MCVGETTTCHHQRKARHGAITHSHSYTCTQCIQQNNIQLTYMYMHIHYTCTCTCNAVYALVHRCMCIHVHVHVHVNALLHTLYMCIS